MTPQCQLVLDHLISHGSLSPVEAATVYRIRHLPRRIADLKALGWHIETEIKKDATGQRYARYRLAPIVLTVPRFWEQFGLPSGPAVAVMAA